MSAHPYFDAPAHPAAADNTPFYSDNGRSYSHTHRNPDNHPVTGNR
jgi:hypothetical protein